MPDQGNSMQRLIAQYVINEQMQIGQGEFETPGNRRRAPSIVENRIFSLI
jgi:hypothetical protein